GGNDAERLNIMGTARFTIGGSGGLAQHVLTIDEIPPHNHGGSTSVNGNHQHNGAAFPTGGAGGGLGVVQSVGNLPGATANIQTFAAGDHSHTIPSQGGGNYHNNVQPTLIVNKIIKVSY